jgi:hypothetical protein
MVFWRNRHFCSCFESKSRQKERARCLLPVSDQVCYVWYRLISVRPYPEQSSDLKFETQTEILNGISNDENKIQIIRRIHEYKK